MKCQSPYENVNEEENSDMKKSQKIKLFQDIQSDISCELQCAYQGFAEPLPFSDGKVVKWEDVVKMVENITTDIQSNIFKS